MKNLKKVCLILIDFLTVLISVICTLFIASVIWMFHTWPYLNMQELVFQIQSPIAGTSQDIIQNYIIFCIPAVIIVLGGLIYVLFFMRKRRLARRITVSVILAVVLIATGITAYVAWKRLDISEYLDGKNTSSSFIDANYADPAEVELVFPEQKRNLIYIFLESMETTYADSANGGAFQDNYISELTTLAQENEDFSGNNEKLNGAVPLNYTTWTAAALFAQTSGLPLTIPIDDNSMDTQESFFPNMTALGDILEQQGYNQTFLIGSNGEFGGRELYFTDHGNYNIKDYYYYQQLGKFPEDYYVWWGYEDQKLFEYAKEELTEMAAQDEPFNLTLLTVDTHFEDGYVCDICGTEYGDNQYANVLACSSRQVSNFVRWIQRQDFYENTTIVISGDHLTMDSDFCADIDQSYERKVYTAYINAAAENEDPECTREYSTFDQFPTTLSALGVQIKGESLGLGTNLFSSKSTLIEKYGKDYVNGELNKKSDLMTRLTSGIVVNDTEPDDGEEKVPTAEATALPYEYLTGTLQIVINNFTNTEDGIAGITAAVWTEEDQSNLQWIQAEALEDGSYLLNVNVPGFGYATGDYYVDIYLTDSNGNQYLVTQTTGYVE